MNFFALLFCAFKAMFYSIFHLPTAPYWMLFLSYFVLFFNSYAYALFEQPDLYSYFPGIAELLVCESQQYKYYIQFLIVSLSLAYNNRFIVFHFHRAFKSLPSDIRRKGHDMLILNVLSSIFIIIFYFLSISINFPHHPILYTLCFIIFLTSCTASHIFPQMIINLKQIRRQFTGRSLITLQIILTSLSILAYFLLIINGFQNNFIYRLYRLNSTLSYLVNTMLFLIDGITIFGSRFIRLSYLIPPQQRRVHRAVSPV